MSNFEDYKRLAICLTTLSKKIPVLLKELHKARGMSSFGFGQPRSEYVDYATRQRLAKFDKLMDYLVDTLDEEEEYTYSYREKTPIKIEKGVISVKTNSTFDLSRYKTTITYTAENPEETQPSVISSVTTATVAEFKTEVEAKQGHQKICELVPTLGSDLKAYTDIMDKEPIVVCPPRFVEKYPGLIM